MPLDSLSFVANGITYAFELTVSALAGIQPVSAINGTATSAAGTNVINTLVSYDKSDQYIISNPGSPYVDIGGISFIVAGESFNLSYDSNQGGYILQTGSPPSYTTYPVTNVAFTSNVCYVEGTRILTERGEVAIEHLRIGDMVVTSQGGRRPVKFLGHRRVDCRNHPRPEQALPIRIGAHAFGPDMPRRDLYVSPGHAICVDILGEVLIRAASLVNGATIQQVEVDSVVYWHVELDSHDIVLAENLPAESYLDMDNRNFFVESGVVSLIQPLDAPAGAVAAFCRPLHEEGAVVEAVRARLQMRALALGWTLERAPLNDLHLLVDGVRIDPENEGLSAAFDIPAGASDIRLVVRTSRPSHLLGENRDTRSLGVCVNRLSLGDVEIALDDARLQQGFHQLEACSTGVFRWTGGEVVLPVSLFGQAPQARRLRLDMLAPPLPFWAAPVARREAEAA